MEQMRSKMHVLATPRDGPARTLCFSPLGSRGPRYLTKTWKYLGLNPLKVAVRNVMILQMHTLMRSSIEIHKTSLKDKVMSA